MKDYKWGRIMTHNQIGLMITWVQRGAASGPNSYIIKNTHELLN